MQDNTPIDLEIVCEGLDFPEGPIALPDGSVVLVEVGRRCLTRVFADGRTQCVATTGGGPNGLAVGPDGLVYVCNSGGSKMLRTPEGTRIIGTADDYSGGRIERVDLRTGGVEVLYRACDGIELSGPNDLVFDRAGGFYFSDLGKTHGRQRRRGALYYATADGRSIREIAFPVSMPNGVGLAPDDSELYFAETETARLWGYRITAPGVLEKLPHPSPNGGRFIFGAGGFQNFDSLKVATNGDVYVGTLENGGITIIPPHGGTHAHLALPDSHVTNLCFGGEDMRTIFVTMAWSGRLARFRWRKPGLRLHFNDRVRF